ncbi:hypothetical protein [Kitasatospora sp. DSM 101779]|uniref:hypothetical protein n=1 Tax=Kitasatospora sp. DSM 101779 TaxID=2853165 RepID=UPI0021D8128C|nr:hypothetical protein [Kitasatospora sp. DSM 101779]MCU7820753.1 hypothetical protein [Kitasatospora sp. DSM 101779]
MSTGTHAESGLTKSIWSDADFDDMGWHYVTIHGLCVQPGDSADSLPRLVLDIDYIIKWVHPVAPEKHFSFWIAPSTLVFEDVWDIEGDLAFKGTALSLDIDQLRRSTPEDDRGGPQWHIEGHFFELTFRATGFRQYLRQAPRHAPRLALSHGERGGLCFAETAFA